MTYKDTFQPFSDAYKNKLLFDKQFANKSIYVITSHM